VVESSASLPPEHRQRVLESLLQLSDWRLLLTEYPSLAEAPAVRGLFALHPSCTRVLPEEGDFRVNMPPGELKVLGSDSPFPAG
jgi:hypothetical protein